jgi:hypothetical protein
VPNHDRTRTHRHQHDHAGEQGGARWSARCWHIDPAGLRRGTPRTDAHGDGGPQRRSQPLLPLPRCCSCVPSSCRGIIISLRCGCGGSSTGVSPKTAYTVAKVGEKLRHSHAPPQGPTRPCSRVCARMFTCDMILYMCVCVCVRVCVCVCVCVLLAISPSPLGPRIVAQRRHLNTAHHSMHPKPAAGPARAAPQLRCKSQRASE